jgi:membrane protein YdbS with pleckstrin-like domain
MTSDTPHTFRSEVDSWIWALIAISLGSPFVLLLWLYFSGRAPGDQLLSTLLILAWVTYFVLWIMNKYQNLACRVEARSGRGDIR